MFLEKSLTLVSSILFGDQTLTELTFVEPNAGQFRAVQAYGGHEMSIRLLALVSKPKVDVPTIERLCARDYRSACDILEGFLIPTDAEK